MAPPQHCRCRSGHVPRAFTRQGFTLYERLNLNKDDCTEKDIDRAYQKMADANHPDKYPDDTEKEIKFIQASEAYSVLSDPKKKEVYDKFGSLGIHVGELVGYNKVERYLTKRSAGYKFTSVMMFLLTGCCFCCCCYFCFCFCCGLCLPKRDSKTAKGIEEGKIKSQNPYEYHLTNQKQSWEAKDKVITRQPKNNQKLTTVPYVEVLEDTDSRGTTNADKKDVTKSPAASRTGSRSRRSRSNNNSNSDRKSRSEDRASHRRVKKSANRRSKSPATSEARPGATGEKPTISASQRSRSQQPRKPTYKTKVDSMYSDVKNLGREL